MVSLLAFARKPRQMMKVRRLTNVSLQVWKAQSALESYVEASRSTETLKMQCSRESGSSSAVVMLVLSLSRPAREVALKVRRMRGAWSF